MPPQFNLLKAKEDLERAIVFAKQSKNEEKNREFFGAMIQTFWKIMSTTMQAISDDVRTVKDEMRKTVEAVKQVKIENQINVAKPDIPKAEVTVNNHRRVIDSYFSFGNIGFGNIDLIFNFHLLNGLNSFPHFIFHCSDII